MLGEGFLAGKFVQQLAAMFRIEWTGEELFANSAEVFDPARVNGRELRFEFASQPLRQRRTLPGGGNRDLQIAPADDRRIVEVAAVGVIHNIAENPATPRLTIDGIIHLNGGRSCYNEESRIKVCALEFARVPCEHPDTIPREDGGRCLRRDDAHVGAGNQQAANFRLSDLPGANHQARARVQLQEHWKQTHSATHLT